MEKNIWKKYMEKNIWKKYMKKKIYGKIIKKLYKKRRKQVGKDKGRR